MRRIINDEALDRLFRAADNPRVWLARPVSDTLLRAVWELVKLGPTNDAGRPARILFLRSEDAKARLAPAIPTAQRETIMTAPIAALVGAAHDPDRCPAGPGAGALEAAYLILAARALGLDCAPVWEHDGAIVDAAFFPDGTGAANFLCGLGYGDHARPLSAERRPATAEACRIL